MANNKTKTKAKTKKLLLALGLAGTIFTGSLLTGCTNEDVSKAQDNIDNAVIDVLNSKEVQDSENSTFKKFTFLGTDVEEAENSKYAVAINGIASREESNKRAYTTFNYLVDNSYFSDEDSKNNEANTINTLVEIVKNEKYNDYSIVGVNNLTALNEAMENVTESPIDKYKTYNNFLYGVSNVEFSDTENIVSFSTKELTKFYDTKLVTSYGIVGYNNDTPKYGPVTKTEMDFESFFIDNNIYLKLTPEEMQRAKADSSFVLDKFVEYVKENQSDKYVVQQVNVANQKEFNANMSEHVNLEDIQNEKQ